MTLMALAKRYEAEVVSALAFADPNDENLRYNASTTLVMAPRRPTSLRCEPRAIRCDGPRLAGLVSGRSEIRVCPHPDRDLQRRWACSLSRDTSRVPAWRC